MVLERPPEKEVRLPAVGQAPERGVEAGPPRLARALLEDCLADQGKRVAQHGPGAQQAQGGVGWRRTVSLHVYDPGRGIEVAQA